MDFGKSPDVCFRVSAVVFCFPVAVAGGGSAVPALLIYVYGIVALQNLRGAVKVLVGRLHAEDHPSSIRRIFVIAVIVRGVVFSKKRFEPSFNAALMMMRVGPLSGCCRFAGLVIRTDIDFVVAKAICFEIVCRALRIRSVAKYGD